MEFDDQLSSVCIVDAPGKIVKDVKVASDIEALVALFGGNQKILARSEPCWLDPKRSCWAKNDYAIPCLLGLFCVRRVAKRRDESCCSRGRCYGNQQSLAPGARTQWRLSTWRSHEGLIKALAGVD
jgi:hypothetical protein